MAKPAADKPSTFVLTYQEVADPAADQVAEALKQLDQFEAEEVLPGTIRVVGERAKVEAAARPLSGEWTISQEGRLSAPPPRKTHRSRD